MNFSIIESKSQEKNFYQDKISSLDAILVNLAKAKKENDEWNAFIAKESAVEQSFDWDLVIAAACGVVVGVAIGIVL